MSYIVLRKKIEPYNKKIIMEGDKSLSIRWALISSQSFSKCRSSNLLMSEDVINTLKIINIKSTLRN